MDILLCTMNKNKSIFKMHNLLTMCHRANSTNTKCVRPMMSSDYCEARQRVLGLYKAFYRYIPYIVKNFDIPKNEEQCRWMLRSYFYKNAYVTDVRVIDLLVIKGFMELKEITHNWQQKGHVIRHWNPSIEPKCSTFMAKFIQGVN